MAYKMRHNLSKLDKVIADKSTPETPIFLKKLEEGVVAEANKDGSIYVDPNTPLNKVNE